ncbi:formate dehydrogenase-N subunit alpha [Pseudothauera nasutitermitis]|uniref:Formate dehydrogenase-N subunit alpha n=1 Tax=Pseudothauera nasutitermitis TaxID=2565930 RepID=A0A4S4B191_9RHOO|nr:formate dehydrogenase-N subunit alpha [Pseudothauera nasutitermitis]THF65417.1 formate dehydrogenase-N subunit alpha [Pseudothauera nasutitermitis]
MQITRRQFFKISTAGLGTSSLTALGMAPGAALAGVRQYKLLRATETRNNCTYCSVGCGLLMYSLGDGAKNAKKKIFHIEGDPDHPVSRGSLCPKGSGLIDYIHSPQRLKYPEVREAGSKEWKRIGWDEAIERIARLMKDDRDANFVERNEKGQVVNRWTTTGFLGSSAASNETGILDVKFARALGMVHLENQARLCHGPSVAGLAPSFGRGAMTNHWVDIKNADVILVMGGNPAEAHPVGFKWAVEAKVRNKAYMMVVDPRFNRTAAVADFYAPIRAGADTAFLLGVANYLLNHDKIQHEYVKAYTNAPLIVREDYGFDEGIFSGYDAEKRAYDRSSWAYELGPDGYALRDDTLQHPRCVFNLLKMHVERYTPDMVSSICGTPREDFLKVCEVLATTCVPERTTSILYALGWTQHTGGSQMIRASAVVQLLLGNIGMPGGGINALRGHSNVQGFTDLGVLTTMLPGYLTLPHENQQSLQSYLDERTPKTLVASQVNFWRNTPKFMVSFLKGMWGDKATAENDFGYHWLPKWDRSYDVMAYVDQMYKGKVNGYLVQGFNVIAAAASSGKVRDALARLKFLVVIDPLQTETASFWENHGEFNDVDPATIQTTVFRLPSSCFAEEDGSIANSARWLQWHWAGQTPPFEARHDGKILGTLLMKLRELYEKEGGAYPEPVFNLDWHYHDPSDPHPEEVTKQLNGYALADLHDDQGRLIARKGELLSSFAHLRDDGSTSSLCWIYTGSWTQAGNQMARRDNTDTGFGNTPGWAFAWPANRRLLYNRASLDPAGKPWDPQRKFLHWDGSRWSGADVPDYPVGSPPNSGVSPFIMLQDGVGHIFSMGALVDGPFPEHYEPEESPIPANPLHSGHGKSPVSRIFKEDLPSFGTREEFPFVATSYSITEMFRHWTKHARLNAIVQPEQFVEISEKLAASKGIAAGDVIKVSSKRGYIRGKAVVTKRVMTLQVAGQEVEQVGIPVHWGFEGSTRKGFLANILTPRVGDANTQTPEYKAFLVNVEKA